MRGTLRQIKKMPALQRRQTQLSAEQSGTALSCEILDACPPLAVNHGRIAIPASLKRSSTESTTRKQTENVCCSMYCDDAMLVNGLIAMGSFKRFAPRMTGVIFSPNAGAYSWLKGIDVVDAQEPLRAAHLDIDAWSRQHRGITGHYYRKVAMWLHMLKGAYGPVTDWHAFIDADVLFVRPIAEMMNYVRPHCFAAMVEHWHRSVWSVFGRETDLSRDQAGQLFHGLAKPSKMKKTGYFNSGVMLARPNDDMIGAVKDVLLASILYPELSRDIRLPEQTLLNVATMVRQIQCCDLFGLCVPSYHDRERGWRAPVVRHYLGDPLYRQPVALRAMYPALVDQSLEALGTSVDELRSRGLWVDALQKTFAVTSSEGALASEGLLASEQALATEGTLSAANAARLRINRPSAFTAPVFTPFECQ